MSPTDPTTQRLPGPVIVCGADRSGTSLVFALLSSHPNISMVRRTNMWRWFHGKFGDLAVPENLDRAIATLSRYERLHALSPDWVRIRSEFGAGEPTYGRLFGLLHSHHAQRLGRPRWGDKSLHSEYFTDAIFAEFPDARVIQTIRDPRDRHASIVRRYEAGSKGIAAATGRWLKSAHAAERNRKRYPGRYEVVRFEDLARDPVAVTEHICSVIGEEFVPEMMAMSGAPEHERGNSSFGDLPVSTISTKPIGRYRSVLPKEDIAFIQVAAGRTMRRFGYDLDELELSGFERMRFASTSAAPNLGRLVAWSMREHHERSRATVPESRLSELT